MRLQIEPSGTFRGPLDCLLKTIRNEGPRALFKGMTGAMASNIFFNAVLFGTFEDFKKRLSVQRPVLDPNTGAMLGHELHVSRAAFVAAASGSGIVESFIYCPLELVKSRLQIQYHSAGAANADTPWSVVRDIRAQRGLVRGLYRGMQATLMREGLCVVGGRMELASAAHATRTASSEARRPRSGNIVYFSTYTTVKQTIARYTESNSLRAVLSGGVTGLAYWCFVYPIDLIKTRLQCDSLSKPRYRGFYHCLVVSVQEHGPLGLYRCGAHAVPVRCSAAALMTDRPVRGAVA